MNARPEPGSPWRLLEGASIHEEVFLRGVLRAREKVRIATANLKNFQVARPGGGVSAVTTLREAARGGTRIEILHGAVPSEPFLHEVRTGPPFPAGRFEMRFCPRVHLKIVIVDYKQLYVGTANFTGAGMGGRHRDARNFEMGLWTRDEGALDEAMALFDRIWSGEACATCRRRRDCPDPLEAIAF